MSIFARLSDLISANINALLDKAENPERMLAQVIRDMVEGLVQARQQAATAIAAERRLARELDQNRAASNYWREQARLALINGREDLARQALARKIEHDDLVRSLQPQADAARQTSGEVKGALRALEARLAEARRKQRTLMARHRAAQVRLQVQCSAGALLPDVKTPFAKFARFEEKLVDMEDHLLAQAEVIRSPADLDNELLSLETTKRIEEELEKLKREIE